MSSTRHAPKGAPISYERYMSSPEFTELRGIPGTAVAAKADLYSDARLRSLLFFLHSLSVRENGLRRLAGALKLGGSREEELTHSLVELCINPKVVLGFSNPLVRAVAKFQERYEAQVRSNFVFTTVGREVFATLDHGLAIGKMVVLEGESGTGKTTAAEAWSAAHQGETRFISLSGITSKTSFFRKLASAIGLAGAKGKSLELQVRVEEFFRRTRLMLVIDEAHYLWPQYRRTYSSPELVNWINTALVNHQVPVALVCTNQFAKLKAQVEKQTGWTSEQFEHRVRRYHKLPVLPTEEDLEAVAASLLSLRWNSDERRWNRAGPFPGRDLLMLVVGYALTAKMRLPAIVATIDEARYLARCAKRSYILATDIRDAVVGSQIPSERALRQGFDSTRRCNAGRNGSHSTCLQQSCEDPAKALKQRSLMFAAPQS